MARVGMPPSRHPRRTPFRPGRGSGTVRNSVRHDPTDTEAGFGFVELIVALTVFSIIVGGLVVTTVAGLALARSNRERSVAANLASRELDAVRQANFASLAIGLTTTTVPIDGVSFVVARNAEWVANAATAGECDSTATAPQVLRVTVDVTWPDMRAVQPVRTSTILSPPVGAYDPNTGHIAVRVRDSNAAPLGTVPVRLQGPGVDRTITTTDAFAASPGCAFFAYVPAGAYTVTLGRAGNVDRQGASSPSQSVGVIVGAIASVAFDYDVAATATITIASSDGGTPAANIAVGLGNTGYLPSGSKIFPGTGTTRTLTGLFPYVDGYELWGGDCADADPEGRVSGVPIWPGAVRADSFQVDPGLTSTATVDLPTVRVDFHQSASPDGVDTIVAVHAADSGCPAGETLTLTTFAANSGTAFVALPYGTWSFRAVGKSPSGSWPSATLDPTASGVQNVDVNI